MQIKVVFSLVKSIELLFNFFIFLFNLLDVQHFKWRLQVYLEHLFGLIVLVERLSQFKMVDVELREQRWTFLHSWCLLFLQSLTKVFVRRIHIIWKGSVWGNLWYRHLSLGMQSSGVVLQRWFWQIRIFKWICNLFTVVAINAGEVTFSICIDLIFDGFILVLGKVETQVINLIVEGKV